MVEHQKFVLRAVADDPQLFQKELNKSLLWLNETELAELEQWLKDNFYKSYGSLLEEVFNLPLVS